MAALNFPPSPSVNDVFPLVDPIWKFNGVAWKRIPRTTDNIDEGTNNKYFTDARVAAAPAVTQLQTDLASEVSTRTSEIARIDTRVNDVLENLDPVKIDSFTEVLSKLSTDKGELSDAIVALGTSSTSAVGVERDARIAADDALSTALTAAIAVETTRAQAAEAALATDLAAESTRALAAESALSTSLTTETTRALAAEAAITQTVADEETRALAAEAALAADLATEVARAGAAETALANSISQEVTRATTAETALDAKIDAGLLAQQAADSSMQTVITQTSGRVSTLESDVSTLKTDVTNLQGSVATEVSRATLAEAALQTAINDEVTARANAVLAEQTRAMAAESTLASDIAAVGVRVDNVLENLDPAKIDSFTEVLSKLSTDKGELSDAIAALGTGASSALTTEIARATAAETQLATDLAAEVARATTAETQLTTDLATETSTRTSEITRVDGLISAQDVRLTTAETSIAGLGTMATQNANNVNITGGTISGVSVNAQSMEVGVGQTADLYVGQDGRVGVGTEAPTEKLTVSGNISVLGGRIKSLGTPVDATDAVTKGYVDTADTAIQTLLDAEVTRATAAELALETSKQLKLTISDTAPAHADGREWVDTTDFRRYISISGAWIEGVVV
jgi:hypothetical protein